MNWWDVVAGADPRIIQGLLTLLASLVASLTAVWVALRAYPRQKAIDHRAQVDKEMREAYASFLNRLGNFEKLVLAGEGELTDTMVEIAGAAQVVALYAPPSALAAIKDYVEAQLEFVSARAGGEYGDAIDALERRRTEAEVTMLFELRRTQRELDGVSKEQLANYLNMH